MGCQTKILLQNTVSHETLFRKKNKHKLTASLEKREWTPHADDRFKSLEEELDNLLKLD